MAHGETILIVDDQAAERAVAGAFLDREGYRILYADNGLTALSQMSAANVDAVLCDVMMPVMDGYSVCRAIKQDVRWRFTPVILVTGLRKDEDIVRGLDAGADEFLSKPVERSVLRARVRAMLRIRRQYDEASRLTYGELLERRRRELVEAAGLSEREKEVFELLLLGRTHEDIAATLGVSVRTSKFHQANLLQKLGADSRADLSRLLM